MEYKVFKYEKVMENKGNGKKKKVTNFFISQLLIFFS